MIKIQERFEIFLYETCRMSSVLTFSLHNPCISKYAIIPTHPHPPKMICIYGGQLTFHKVGIGPLEKLGCIYGRPMTEGAMTLSDTLNHNLSLLKRHAWH